MIKISTTISENEKYIFGTSRFVCGKQEKSIFHRQNLIQDTYKKYHRVTLFYDLSCLFWHLLPEQSYTVTDCFPC